MSSSVGALWRMRLRKQRRTSQLQAPRSYAGIAYKKADSTSVQKTVAKTQPKCSVALQIHQFCLHQSTELSLRGRLNHSLTMAMQIRGKRRRQLPRAPKQGLKSLLWIVPRKQMSPREILTAAKSSTKRAASLQAQSGHLPNEWTVGRKIPWLLFLWQVREGYFYREPVPVAAVA